MLHHCEFLFIALKHFPLACQVWLCVVGQLSNAMSKWVCDGEHFYTHILYLDYYFRALCAFCYRVCYVSLSDTSRHRAAYTPEHITSTQLQQKEGTYICIHALTPRTRALYLTGFWHSSPTHTSLWLAV